MTYIEMPYRPGGPLSDFEFRPDSDAVAAPWAWFDRQTGKWATPATMAHRTGAWGAALCAHGRVMDSLRRTADQLLDDIETSQQGGLAEVEPGAPLEASCIQIAERLEMARMFMADFVVEARHAGAAVVDVHQHPQIVEDLLHMLADATNAIGTLHHAVTPRAD